MDYFPLTIAQGSAFCNRINELQSLRNNIELVKPTLIVSPRRFGKTSLVLNSIEQTGLPYVQFDFLSAINEEDIERIILKGIGKLIMRIEKGPRKALKLATDFFAGLSIQTVVDKVGLSIEIKQRMQKPVATILNTLERLEALSQKYNKKIILFFDEFQQISEVTNDMAVESVIRQVAQRAKNIVFIFSGSNRHLLNNMFNDKTRPFYKMCDRIELERIAIKAYTPYLQKAAKIKWKKLLSAEVLELIFFYTKQHAYYMNLLCSRLWELKQLPTVDDVTHTWDKYIQQERSLVANELDTLSKNQRKLLITLARQNGVTIPRGNEFVSIAKMSGATISQALEFLVRKDYVYRDNIGHYQLLDPLIQAVIVQ
jgi:AAA+ ATPase superfamily predicted ATPase